MPAGKCVRNDDDVVFNMCQLRVRQAASAHVQHRTQHGLQMKELTWPASLGRMSFDQSCCRPLLDACSPPPGLLPTHAHILIRVAVLGRAKGKCPE